MKLVSTLLFALLIIQACSSNQSILELSPSQSMCITGKGPGQDGAINPYSGLRSVAIVKNVGKESFSIRVQEKGMIVKEIEIGPKEKKEVILEKGYELYFDSNLAAKGQVSFRKG